MFKEKGLEARMMRWMCVLLLMTCIAGCGPGAQASGKKKVVATVGMVADVARNVAGEASPFQIVSLMGTGVDPHLYKPTREDQAAMLSADLVLFSGHHLEGKMVDGLHEQASRGRAVVAVAETIDHARLVSAGAGSEAKDPHIWMDPTLWSETVDVIASEFAKLDPPNADRYRANAVAYKAKLAELHAYGQKVLASISAESRVLITSHDAFQYLGRAYGMQVEGIQGISTESESGLQRRRELVDLIVNRKVRAVFAESSVNPKSVEGLIEDAGKRGWTVTQGGVLFSDAMGNDGTYEGTYIGMIDHNLTTIARALGGDAPERGLNGKLASHAAAGK
jgi:manganese/zinc/iron transport system substrate-binding protein